MSQVKKSFSSKEYRVSYQVPEEADGMRLDQFIQGFLSSFSRQAVKKKIQSGDITIIGRPHPHKPSSKVYHREEVEIVTINKDDELLEKPEVIFEDDDILVTTKPAFMATHPTGKHLFKCLTVFYEEIYGHTIHSIHRLDRETSGVQVLGKSPQGANKITPYFEKALVEKAYFFIAKSYEKPLPELDQFEANERLGQEDDYIPRLLTHCYPQDSEKGKRAQTKFHIFYEDSRYAMGLAFPKTGRQHQIRAHAAFYGYPLLGDKLYNGDPGIFMRFQDEIPQETDPMIMEIERQALHALALKFPYPNQDSEKQIFRAPIPLDLKSWIDEKLEMNSEQAEKKIEKILKDWC